jgi:hypothetical protein
MPSNTFRLRARGLITVIFSRGTCTIREDGRAFIGALPGRTGRPFRRAGPATRTGRNQARGHCARDRHLASGNAYRDRPTAPTTLLVILQARERAALVAPHQAGVADNVGSEDHRQFSLLTGQWNFPALLQWILEGSRPTGMKGRWSAPRLVPAFNATDLMATNPASPRPRYWI